MCVRGPTETDNENKRARCDNTAIMSYSVMCLKEYGTVDTKFDAHIIITLPYGHHLTSWQLYNV